MASPHVAGVGALIVSRYGDASSPPNGKLRPGEVESILQNTATPQDCPSTDPFRAGTVDEARCRGGWGHNGFYGNGQVDALAAITR